MGRFLLRLLLGAVLTLAAVVFAPPASAKNALEMLRKAPQPRFREGHTLLPLTRWGWTLAPDVRIELAAHWGYALEFGPDATMDYVKQLDDPKSVPSRLCALAASNPSKYPLCVLAWRPFNDKRFIASLPEEAWCHDAQGKLVETPSRQLSPETPDAVFVKAGALAAEPLKKVREKAPIAVVLNGGEYALNVIGFAGPVWEKDPKVLKAKGQQGWYEYISQSKARQELLISKAIRQATPGRRLYIYYHTSGCPQRDSYDGWWRWAWDYQWMKPVSDLPNISIYYKQFNSGWTGKSDMLTQALNAVGRDIALGQPLSYNWVCGGWVQEKLGPKAFSEPERYMGFLKCYYAAGMTGAVAGYFSFPKGGFEGDLGDRMPHWLQQMVILGHAHALFSHLDEFLRDGDLLPGPERHRWSKDQPACEFPTGDPEVRVLVRRHKARPEWLLVAWAAGGGDRNITVTVPDLGQVTLQARPCGSVYRAVVASGQPSLKRVDENGMYPTK